MVAPATVGIIGVGLMGGSLGKALRQSGRFDKVIGYDSSPESVERARRTECVDEIVPNVHDVAAAADLLILAAPVGQIVRLIDTVGPSLKPGTIVLDIGSTKSVVAKAMRRLPDTVEAIGGHPMTGPTTVGVGGISAEMFRDRVFVLTPTSRTSPATLAWCESTLAGIGARVVVLDPDRHDRLVGLVSHLPRLLPVPLLATVLTNGDDVALRLAAGGFRESTRKATDNIDMWVDIVLSNADYLTAAATAFTAQLDRCIATIATKDESAVRRMLTDAADQWHERFGDDA